jgi:isoquinoline 1-oxidoreductase beta subunit
VAIAAGKDPVQFRLDLLQKARTKPVGTFNYNIDRMETVIKTAAERSGWGYKEKRIARL